MLKNRNFQHNNNDYEVRLEVDGNNTVHVRVFTDAKPANGYTYSVDLGTRIDAMGSNSFINPLEELIETAISDVKSGIWEEYVSAISSTEN